MNIIDVESVLVSNGFTKTKSSSLGNRYSRQLNTGFTATAYASLARGFFDTEKSDQLRKVDFTLDSKGTIHCCLSVAALKNKTIQILAQLEKVSQTPELLKCPKCGKRDVHTKEPLPGRKQFKPFLSCSGMMIERKGAKKDVICDGVSTALPALYVHTFRPNPTARYTSSFP